MQFKSLLLSLLLFTVFISANKNSSEENQKILKQAKYKFYSKTIPAIKEKAPARSSAFQGLVAEAVADLFASLGNLSDDAFKKSMLEEIERNFGFQSGSLRYYGPLALL